MKSFNDFEIHILQQLSSFRKEGIVNLKDVLEKIFFNTEEGKALIIQLREQYAIYFLTNKTYNNPITQKEAIIQFSQLLALFEFLNTQGIISIFRTQHFVKDPMYFLNSDFHEPKIENKKIILNDNGLYTDKPEEIKNAKGEVVYKGIQFNDSHFVIKNLMGSLVISNKISEILKDIDVKKIKPPFLKRKSTKISALLLLFLGTFFGLHYYHYKNTKALHRSVKKLHQKVNSNTVKISKKTYLKTKRSQKKRKLYGIDISKWSGNILDDKLPDSLKFVICKATEGLDYTDPKFNFNWKQIQKLKLKRGAYHFYVIDDNPKKQALHFWNAIKDIQHKDFPPIVDIETASDENSTLTLNDVKKLQTNLLIFLNTIEDSSNRTPMIYSSFFYANKYLTSKKFAKYPLWVADYESTKSPIVPNTWKKTGWTIWQKSPSYKIDATTVDLDIYIEK